MNTNPDGKVTKKELSAELQRQMQIANARMAQQLQGRMGQLDTNRDGQLSLQEFIAIQPQIRPSQSPEQCCYVYVNHDGTLTAEEFRAAEMAKFNQLDTNHDRVVPPAEIDGPPHIPDLSDAGTI